MAEVTLTVDGRKITAPAGTLGPIECADHGGARGIHRGYRSVWVSGKAARNIEP